MNNDKGSSGDRPAGDAEPLSFEAGLEELEQIVRRLEDGQLELAQAMQHYERGIGLLRQCHGLLAQAERRVELLTGTDERGQPVAAPFDEESLTLEEKANQRHRRRSHPSADE